MPGAGGDMHSQGQLLRETVWLSGEEMGKVKAELAVDSDRESLGRRQPVLFALQTLGARRDFSGNLSRRVRAHA